MHARPRHRHALDLIYLVVNASHAGETLKVDWYATSTSVNGMAEGRITIQVEPEPLPPSPAPSDY